MCELNCELHYVLMPVLFSHRTLAEDLVAALSSLPLRTKEQLAKVSQTTGDLTRVSTSYSCKAPMWYLVWLEL